MQEITKELLEAMFPRNKYISTWVALLNSELPKYDINTPYRIAGFISQVGVESSGFTALKENLNYSESGLKTTFGKRVNGVNLAQYARNPEKIANLVYSNRLGNGSEQSGDGWKFRGRGLIQLTGKYNYLQYANYIHESIDNTIRYLETPEGALNSSCWYWDTHSLNSYCDSGDIVKISKAVNGGTNGLTERKILWEQVLKYFNATINTATESDKDEIKKAQKILKVTQDGVFGPNSTKALKNWQAMHGITPTGLLDSETKSRLFR